jgi:threonylcarbamoyladenosine tRNA methylthiotransferase MtaB
MNYSIVTFGCRVNQADSLGFEEQLRAGGATETSADLADVVIVNTCSVTASADQAARQAIRRIARTNPAAKVVVTGCYATRRREDVEPLPNVLRVVPNEAKPHLVSWLTSGAELSTAERFGGGEGSCGAAIEPGVAGRTAFTLRVQTGCSQPCAYCIIPSTRGVPRSVESGSVLAEIERVIAAGFKEIVLTGVHLGSYGRDLAPASSLMDLLDAIEGRVSDRCRSGANVLFRISSLEPMDCPLELVDRVAGSACIARHFHLPLQHASNRVLKGMRRPYTIERYARLVDAIRAKMPDAAIGSDVIVGFPGESEQDFEALAAYLAQSPLTHLHVFPYSDRPGTAASQMNGKVSGPVIRERSRRVREISDALTRRFRTMQLGSVQRALTLADGSLAVTGNYLKVQIPPGRSRNEWVDVKVIETGAVLRAAIVEQFRPKSPPSADASSE